LIHNDELCALYNITTDMQIRAHEERSSILKDRFKRTSANSLFSELGLRMTFNNEKKKIGGAGV
jgi:hypothetical protein